MAKAISSEELQLKKRARRRLVGAIALVLAVVVFLPMILDNKPKPVSQDIAINIPPPPGETDDELAAAPSEPLRFRPIEESPGTAQSGESVPQQEASAPPPAATTPNPPVNDKPPATQSSAATAVGGFVVQLGAFSDAGNAAKLAAKVRDSRFDAYTEVVSTPSGKRTRVRVGPFPTRAAAEEARDRLKARKLTYGEPAIIRPGE